MHIPVLAGPAIDWLGIREDGIYVDCTAGAGGHAERILERLPRGRLIALDRDPAAVQMTRTRLGCSGRVTVLHRNYGDLKQVLLDLAVSRVNGILIDAGLSSIELDDPQRGFSFQQEGPLDMRMDTTQSVTAKVWLENATEQALIRALREYGDVRSARRIARAILRSRDAGQLSTTSDLAKTVAKALGVGRGFPEETRAVFQAIRIAVNDELRWLESGTRQAIDVLCQGGRLVTIAFHSGEDRIIKSILREASTPRKECLPDGRTIHVHPPAMRILTKKPVRPDEEEIRINPRSHSAKLRAAERLADSESVTSDHV